MKALSTQNPTMDTSPLNKVDYIELSYDAWRERFKPIQNPFDPNADFHGCLLDISAIEKHHIVTADPQRLWTLIDGNGDEFIASGWHFIDRTGWFLTEVPVPPRTEVTVTFPDFEDIT